MIIWGSTNTCCQHYIPDLAKVNHAQTQNKEDSPCAIKLNFQNRSFLLFYRQTFDYEYDNIMDLTQQI